MDDSEDMHSLLLTDSSTLLVGGLQNHVVEIDLNTVQETQKVRPGAPRPAGALSWCSAPLTPCSVSLPVHRGGTWHHHHEAIKPLLFLWAHLGEGNAIPILPGSPAGARVPRGVPWFRSLAFHRAQRAPRWPAAVRPAPLSYPPRSPCGIYARLWWNTNLMPTQAACPTLMSTGTCW